MLLFIIEHCETIVKLKKIDNINYKKKLHIATNDDATNNSECHVSK